MRRLPDNIFWHALIGPQARFAVGAGAARRYAAGLSPIAAFADLEQPDFAALAPFCAPGEHLYCGGWSGPALDGWNIDAESTMFRMVWDAAMPAMDEIPEAVQIGPEHATAAFELAALTRPGPFGPRTIELGEYYGVFDGPRLIAMAGERIFAGSFREISGVCTHPDFQGRGLARKLMNILICLQMRRGETPFLHVMRDNEGAHRLYQRMGFVDALETVVRVISRA